MAKEKRLGVGVVGLGWVAGPHIDAWRSNPRAEVVALASHSHDHAAEVREQHGIQDARIYTDWAALMKDERVDVVDICSTNHLHVQQGVAAAEAGKHVLIEKPIAMDVAGLRRIEAAVDRSGVKSLVSFVLRWGPYFGAIRSMLDADFFGRIFYAECDYFSGNWDLRSPAEKWSLTREKGGSALLTGGCHAVDALRHFVRSEAVEVFAYSDNFGRKIEWDPTITMLVRFENGTIGKSACVLEGNCNYQFNLRLHGQKGMLIGDRFISHLIPGQTDLVKLTTVMPDTADVAHHPFPGEIDYFARCILEDRVPVPDVKDAVKTHELIFAAQMSAAEGKPIKLPLAR